MTRIDAARRAALEAAYRDTTYGALVPLRIRVGEENAMLDALLAEVGEDEWAFLTAWNPGSEPRSDAENAAAQEALHKEMADAGHLVLSGAGVPDDPAWTPEPSFLVPGLALADALALARKYGQAAIVAGRRGERPRLVFLD